MKKYIFLLIILLAMAWAGQVEGATYYVRPAATCATNGDGTLYACTEGAAGTPGAWNALASVLWDGAGEVSAGDTLYVAGTFTNEILTIGVSGTGVGTETIIRGDYAGNPGIIDRNAAGTYAISTNQKNYLKILNITAKNGTTSALYINGTSHHVIVDGLISTGDNQAIYATVLTTNITVQNSTSTDQACGTTTAAMLFAGSVGLTLTDNTLSGASGIGIQVNGAAATTSSILLHGNQVTGTVAGVSIYIRLVTAGTITLTDNYVGITKALVATANGNTGILINGNTGGSLYVDGNYSSNNTDGQGIYVQTNTLASGSYIKNSYFNSNTYQGIYIKDSPNITISNNEANSNLSCGIYLDGATTTGIIVENNVMNSNKADGFNTHNGVSNVIVRYNRASLNGDAVAGTGDGYSSHDADSVYYYYNLAYANLNTGISNVQTSTGRIWNNVIYGNGTAAPDDRCGLYITSTANPGWDVRNNIIAQNLTKTGSCDIMENPSSNNTFLKNIYFPVDDDKFYALDDAATTFITYANAPTSTKNGAIKGDPLFVDTTDFELDTGSPAKNAGWCGSRAVSMTDYDGTTIIGRPDIGAQESSTAGAQCGQRNLNLLWLGK